MTHAANSLVIARFSAVLLLIFCLSVAFSSCQQKKAVKNDLLNKELQAADRFYFSNRYDTGKKVLIKLRSRISTSSPLIVDYYYEMDENYISDNLHRYRYADSALAFFSDMERVKTYPDEYFKALILKGDAALKSGEYILALNYYFKCKNVLKLGICDDGDLASKLGVIYYAQKNYQLAGRYWAESYNHIGKCNEEISVQKLFFIKQGALDNAAYAYEQAGITDSAKYYYLQDISLISDTRKKHLLDIAAVNTAQAVVDDNFGGLNLTTGDLPAAKYYLEKSVAFPVQNNSGSGMSAYSKLANLYVQLGDMPKAAAAFAKSRYLIDHYNDGNPDPEIIWNKSYSQFLLKSHQIAGAYQYLQKYNDLKALQYKNNYDLYRLDVVREFNDLQQKQSLTELEQSERQKKVYVSGTAVIVILSIVIISLIYRNLKKTEKNNKLTTLQNRQLQHTLSELERVNKNHIRIMRVMAHDLRNPLSGITGLAAMLLEDGDISTESKHMLRLIEKTGLHTIEMISELLNTGLADENEQLEKHFLDIRALVFDSVELLQFKANDKEQQLLFDGDNAPIIANVNHENIWRMVNNLIVNAIKFSYNNGVIKVCIKADVNNVLISVADNGVGIPDSLKNVIFEMFTSAKRYGTDGEQPFGLGLSISKRIIEMHNGKIWFESQEGKGTTFFVQLPLK